MGPGALRAGPHGKPSGSQAGVLHGLAELSALHVDNEADDLALLAPPGVFVGDDPPRVQRAFHVVAADVGLEVLHADAKGSVVDQRVAGEVLAVSLDLVDQEDLGVVGSRAIDGIDGGDGVRFGLLDALADSHVHHRRRRAPRERHTRHNERGGACGDGPEEGAPRAARAPSGGEGHCQTPTIQAATQYRTAETAAAAGRVRNHATTMFPATPHRTAENLLVQPTPMIAVETTWVVEIGAWTT